MKYLDVLKKGMELGNAYEEWASEINRDTQSERAETLRYFLSDNSNYFTPLLEEKGLLSYDDDLIIYRKVSHSDEEFYNKLAEIYCYTSGIITESENDFYEICKRVGDLCKDFYSKITNDTNELKMAVSNVSGKETRLKNIWYDELKELLVNGSIDRAYCFSEKGFSSDYYMVVTKEREYFLIEHTINNVNTKFMVMGLVSEVGNLPYLTRISYDEIVIL